MTSDNKARNYWVDDPRSADADWLKLVLRLRTLEGLKAGSAGVRMTNKIVNIGDSDENADWIKTPENRASEQRIHDELAEEYAKQRGTGQGQDNEPVCDGGASHCYCPECQALFVHQRDEPCNQMLCSECGGILRGATAEEVSLLDELADEKSVYSRVKQGFADIQDAVLGWLRGEVKVGGEKDLSLDGRIDKIRADFNAEYRKHISVEATQDIWLDRIYDDYVIVTDDGQMYKVSYQEVDTDKFEFAPKEAWVKVEQVIEYIPDVECVEDAISDVEDSIADLADFDKECAFAFKTISGEDWWFQFTTNAFEDREQELFTTKALEEYVERHRDDDVKGQFWYRHLPGTKFGNVRWQAMVGRFLAQAGPFDDTPVGIAFKEFFNSHPDGHEVIAPNGWGTSHGYRYIASDRKDGVYHWLEIKESTVLPLGVAANIWSPMPLVIRSSKMNDREKKELEEIGGSKLVNLVLAAGKEQTKKLESGGVAYKAMSDLATRLLTISEEIEDADIRARLEEIVAEVGMRDVLEEEIPEEDSEMLPEEDLMVVPEGEKAAVEEETAEEPMTRAEVVDALKLITTHLRDELKVSDKGIADVVVTAMQPLVDEIAALKRADSEKIAEKASQTPAASLRDLITSAIGAKEVELGKDETPRGPKETAPKANSLFIEQFMGGSSNG